MLLIEFKNLYMNTNAIPLIRVSAFLPFIKFLDQIGSPTERLLQQAKVPIFALEDPEALIPLYQSCVFVEQAARLEGIENLGILVGQKTQIADLGLFGHLLCQSLTLYELLTTLEQTVNTFDSGEQVWIVQQGDQVWLHHRFNSLPTLENQQARLYNMMLYLKAFQLVLGQEWRPLAMQLQVNPSRSLTDIKPFADSQLYFAQSSSAIIFSRSLFSSPLKQPAPLHTAAYQFDYETLQSSAPSPDFLESLRQLLRSLLRDGYPDIALAAEIAGMSSRSLQRRLAENDLSYSHLVEKVRFKRAVNLLQDADIKLIEISAELGYTDAANFTRAFKRWAGISPREFRNQHIKA
jgi:AraC-like DNA-binding protein